jgi:MFS family permease
LTIGTDFTGALMLVLPIERAFAADITTTQWVLNIYALTFAMGVVTAGRLADLFGRRRLLMIGMAVIGIFVALALDDEKLTQVTA